uniref:Uncharacterized protein n=1 Tax=Anopheles coluzzii TaxID=1518534 RepID=A0A8W7PUA3_ANOCL
MQRTDYQHTPFPPCLTCEFDRPGGSSGAINMPITVTANASGGVALGPAAAAAAEIAAASSPSVSRHSHQPALSYRSNVFAAALRWQLDTTASRPVSWVVES